MASVYGMETVQLTGAVAAQAPRRLVDRTERAAQVGTFRRMRMWRLLVLIAALAIVASLTVWSQAEATVWIPAAVTGS